MPPSQLLKPADCRAASRLHGDASYRLRLAVAAVMALLTGCEEELAPLGEPFRPTAPHQQYAESLRELGLDSTALGRDWLLAARSAVQSPLTVVLPFRETGYLPADEPHAIGYEIAAERGQRLIATVRVEAEEPMRVFVDLFEVSADTLRRLERVASAEGDSLQLEWEPARDGSYLLRIQPELLRSGRYTATILSRAALAFPVEGLDTRAIQSGFGADRDGGRREHHGVDIFAPRGTPAVAAAAGYVSRVQTTPRGGNVVWLRDSERRQSLYYAHLDSQTVVAGARVEIGDTLGLIGNTGNARSTPPHLHFGIYRRGEGPIDPFPFLYTPPADVPALAADTTRLGSWVRNAESGLRLRMRPSQDAPVVTQLPLHTPLRVLAAAGAWYRVSLPDDRRGYVAARLTEPADAAIRHERLAGGATLRDQPALDAVVIDTLDADASLPVLARFNGFLLVEAPGDRLGWLAAD